jgi:hypothetical protein
MQAVFKSPVFMSLTDAPQLRNDAKYDRDEKGKFVSASEARAVASLVSYHHLKALRLSTEHLEGQNSSKDEQLAQLNARMKKITENTRIWMKSALDSLIKRYARRHLYPLAYCAVPPSFWCCLTLGLG